MNNNNYHELQEPLNPSQGGAGDESASQGSQRSSASLLERIRAQRAAEQAPAATIQVPQYNPVAQQDNFAGGGPAAENTSSNFFSSAWNNISESMESGMASLQQEVDMESDQALLAPSNNYLDEEHYSMSDYFFTFVNDVYKAFLALPFLVRLTVIFALLFTAFKLM